MVAFTETVRQRCRKCKGKLASPTSNDREAFCCAGCYRQFYWKRCRACECTITQGSGTQRITCNKPACKSAWRQKVGFGRFLTRASSVASMASEIAVPQALASAPKPIEWRIVAGPALSDDAFAAATVPDGPTGQWSGGSFQRVEAGNRALLRKHAADQQRRLISHAFAIERAARWPVSEPERLAA